MNCMVACVSIGEGQNGVAFLLCLCACIHAGVLIAVLVFLCVSAVFLRLFVSQPSV